MTVNEGISHHSAHTLNGKAIVYNSLLPWRRSIKGYFWGWKKGEYYGI